MATTRKATASDNKRNLAVVKRVIKRHGPVLDLERDPGALIDIIRRFGHDLASGDNPCGGTPPAPGPGTAGGRLTNEDLMRAILRLTREVSVLKKQLSRR